MSGFDSSWNRGKFFIDKYSLMHTMILNDSSIETERPTFFGRGYGYKLTARKLGDSTFFVSALCYYPLGNLFDFSSDRNVYILIDYMKNDTLPYPQLISK